VFGLKKTSSVDSFMAYACMLRLTKFFFFRESVTYCHLYFFEKKYAYDTLLILFKFQLLWWMKSKGICYFFFCYINLFFNLFFNILNIKKIL
jgi:hypothetical protein